MSRVHFVYAFLFTLAILAYDAWKLIAPEDVLTRWKLAALLLIVTTLVWYIAKTPDRQPIVIKSCLYALIMTDLFVAANLVYSERGMASRAAMLFVIPIIVSYTLERASALFAAAALATAAYTFAAVRYFVVHFNEGYKFELYATLAFYSAIFFVVAGLLSSLMMDRARNQ